ncbi:MAG: non-ribosomal peptide synthetase [Sphaerochaeta sp.]
MEYKINDVLGRFKNLAASKKEEILLIGKNEKLSYEEVDKMSDFLAFQILTLCGTMETRIGLHLSHSSLTIISIIGLLKVGKCYVPLSSKMPQKRLDSIIETSGIKTVITDGTFRRKDLKTIEISLAKLEEESRRSVFIEPHEPKLSDEVYVLYTSGSTGEPKGCSVSYKNLLYILNNMQKICPADDSSTYVFSTPFFFDVSITEIFGWLFGAKILSIDLTDFATYKKLPDILFENKISHFAASPSSFLHMLSFFSSEDLDKMVQNFRFVMIAGEAFKSKIATIWNEKNWDFKLFNLYGPTEATVYATCYELKKGINYNSIPIGKCLDGCCFHILQKNENGIGELVLGGDGVISGYLGNSEIINKSFYKEKNTWFYKTGDLVSEKEGLLYFHGRKDNQVQIHGIRIELGEIEHEIRSISGVSDAAVAFHDNKIFANIEKRAEDKEEIILGLISKTLPSYMIPNDIAFVSSLPKTSTNKINRNLVVKNCINNKRQKNEKCEKVDIEVVKILQLFQQVLGLDEKVVHQDSDFFELGGDSLSVLLLASKLEKEFNIRVNVDDIYMARTPGKVLSKMIHRGIECSGTHGTLIKEISKLNIKILDFVFSKGSLKVKKYEAIYNQYRYYRESFDRAISFAYHVDSDHKKEEIELSLRKLYTRNPILRSKLYHNVKNNKLYIEEYELSESEVFPFVSICDISMLEEGEMIEYLEYINSLVFYSRYSDGFSSVAVMIETPYGFVVHFTLDHCISDASCISVIKNEFAQILMNKDLPKTADYKYYCELLRKKNSLSIIENSDYYKKISKCQIPQKELFIENITNSHLHFTISNIEFLDNFKISVLVSYFLCRLFMNEFSLEQMAPKVILNSRELVDSSFKNVIGDMHKNVRLYITKEMSFDKFQDCSLDILNLFSLCFFDASVVTDHGFKTPSKEVAQVKKVLKNSTIITINYLGFAYCNDLDRLEKEAYELQDYLYEQSPLVLCTAYSVGTELHIFVNKKITETEKKTFSLEEVIDSMFGFFKKGAQKK